MLRFTAQSEAPPDDAWALLAQPARWHEWAPHIRGAWGLGAPEVRPGAAGFVRLLGVVPVPARIVEVDDGPPTRSWSWRVGPVLMDHRVEPRAGGCTVAVQMHAAPPVEAALAVTYGPIVRALVARLARVAATGR